MSLTRSQFERLVEHLIERSMGPCRQALQDAGLNTGDVDEVILVGGQTRTPLVKRRVEELFGRASHRGINPDEVVALGAAIQAGVLGGNVDDMLLMDVTPLTLSIETLGGVATPLIPRNTTIPAREEQTFSTTSDNQTRVQINVLQGEHPMAASNKLLGSLVLFSIPPAPKGVPKIAVTFDIDANGILKVSARDKATGRSQHITITASSGLSEDEIKQMIWESAVYTVRERLRTQLANALDRADSLAHTAEGKLGALGDAISAARQVSLSNMVFAISGQGLQADLTYTRELVSELSKELGIIASLQERLRPVTPDVREAPRCASEAPPLKPSGTNEESVDKPFS